MQVKWIWVFLVCNFFVFVQLWAQEPAASILGVTPDQEAQYKAWIDDLYEMGVEIRGDSIFIAEEARKAALDSSYRLILYPPEYTWADAQYLMKQMHLKIGFWYMINLYMLQEANKEAVLRFLIPFDEIFEMDRVLTAVMYTYGMMEPGVMMIVDGKPDIRHPEIAEMKLAQVKEIIRHIHAHRATRQPQD